MRPDRLARSYTPMLLTFATYTKNTDDDVGLMQMKSVNEITVVWLDILQKASLLVCLR